MTSVLSTGRYKQKKEWSTNSIPESVSNAESSEDVENNEPTTTRGIEIQVNGVPQQFSAARRASLASGLFSDHGRKLSQPLSAAPNVAKNNKRRSSIAVAFLGRKDNAKNKNDEAIKGTSVFYDDNNDTFPDYQLGLSDKDPGRKRRSSWQAKMERRRRKSLANTRIDENSVTIMVDSTAEDQESDSEEQQQGGVGLPLGAPGNPYHRQKRHSWWNILVPDNLKAR